jgi:hypothetical protein
MLSEVRSCRIVRNSFGDVIPVLFIGELVIHKRLAFCPVILSLCPQSFGFAGEVRDILQEDVNPRDGKWMAKESMLWLWVITGLNLGLGTVLWIYNFVVAENNDEGVDPGVEASAILWQAIGANFFGFGVLALLITFATAAITSAITSSDRH